MRIMIEWHPSANDVAQLILESDRIWRHALVTALRREAEHGFIAALCEDLLAGDQAMAQNETEREVEKLKARLAEAEKKARVLAGLEDIEKESVSRALKAGSDDLLYLSYCGECNRWFDSRVGCPTDVATDSAAEDDEAEDDFDRLLRRHLAEENERIADAIVKMIRGALGPDPSESFWRTRRTQIIALLEGYGCGGEAKTKDETGGPVNESPEPIKEADRG